MSSLAALRAATRPLAGRLQDATREELCDRAERLQELAVLSLFLHSAASMEEMLALFLERSSRVTGAVVTYPLLLDRRREILEAKVLADSGDLGLEQASMAAGRDLTEPEYTLPLRSWRQEVMDGGEVVVGDSLRDALGDVLGKSPCDQIQGQLQISKIAAAPLVMEGEVFGLCLFLFSGEAPDVELLELVVGHLTLALKDLAANHEGGRYGGIDPLTWVYTRGHFLEALEAEVLRARRYGRGLSFILLDIDGFAEFNSNYGRTLGDRLLRAFAMALAGFIDAPEVAARTGADEFGLVLPETDRAAAVELTSAIVRKLAALSVFEEDSNEKPGVSASIAIVSYPEDGVSRDELLAAAELGLEQAKAERREAMAPKKELTPVQQLFIGRRHYA